MPDDKKENAPILLDAPIEKGMALHSHNEIPVSVTRRLLQIFLQEKSCEKQLLVVKKTH